MMVTACIYDSAARCWLTGNDIAGMVTAHREGDVLPALSQVEKFVEKENGWAVGFLSYEAAPAFDPAMFVRPQDSSFPLLWFALFKQYKRFDLPRPAVPSTLDWTSTISKKHFTSAIARIHKHISEGDTYQVNFSFRLQSTFHDNPFQLFQQIAQAQPTQHGAYIESPEFAICSASPELFFSLNGNRIISRPMKGTAARGFSLQDDCAIGEALRRSEKNRAENLMIVDMIRNDMGRIADVDSVHVPSLFDLEKYPTVWQLTSTIEGKTGASISEIMKAMFPCASITGAPKVSAMKIISELESTPRNIYTGAIGFIAPQRRAQFNVAIRTVLVDKKTDRAEYGSGSGIVWASTADGEYEECLVKTRMLTEERPEFDIFETMLFTPGKGYLLLDEHLLRMKISSEYFGFDYDDRQVRECLNSSQCELEKVNSIQRVRLMLDRTGKCEFQSDPIAANDKLHAVRVKISPVPVDSKNLFLYHKTTNRRAYDDAIKSVSNCDDVLLWNERDEITESTIANVVAEFDGKLFTPPVECGLLAGTYRATLLNAGLIEERIIKKDQLRNAQRIFLINSVRTWRAAKLID